MPLDPSTPERVERAVQAELTSPRWAARSIRERAHYLAVAVCDALLLSVPGAAAAKKALKALRRNELIRSQFDGTNYAELAERHDLHPRHIRRIVDAGRKPEGNPTNA